MQITIELSDREYEALEKIAEKWDMSHKAVVLQGLRYVEAIQNGDIAINHTHEIHGCPSPE